MYKETAQVPSNLFKRTAYRLLAIFIAELAALGLIAEQTHSQVPLILDSKFFCEVQKDTPNILIYTAQDKVVPFAQENISRSENQPSNLSIEQLQELAKSITVRVSSAETWGSGIIIKRQGQNYLVLTNQHVLVPKEQYRVQTSDGNQYPAMILQSTQFGDYDLVLLQFHSPNYSYLIASLGMTFVKPGDEVFAAGFPIEAKESSSKGFVFNSGSISKLMYRAFIGGYQIGNTTDVKQGMSGGPLLNHQGEVVGINGLGKNPAFTNPYVFRDRSTIYEAEWQQVSQLSWAIPIQTFVQLAPKSLNDALLHLN